MSLSHRYNDFGDEHPNAHTTELDSEDMAEDEKLQAFEDGYKAGWLDATAAHETEQGRISIDFAQNLQDLSFTYQEARSKLIRALRPVFEQIIEKLVPELIGPSLRAHLLEQFMKLIQEQTESAIEITVSCKNFDTIESFLKDQSNVPFNLIAEAALGDGQVYLRAGQSETSISIDEVAREITLAMEGFFSNIER